jgi:glycosyltransferase involved in cell wall biosynthesis
MMNQKPTQKSLPKSKKRPKNPLFSFVIPAYREEGNIVKFLLALQETIEKLGFTYEFIVVDDGSPDKTAEFTIELGQKIPLKYIRLSRNFGKEQALTAGLKYASGDAAILIDSDFQHPLKTIEQFIKFWFEGYDMVYGVRKNRDDDGYIRRYFTRLFYKLLNWFSRIPIEANAGDFRLLDRKIINALNSLPERTRFMKGLYAWVGFKSIGIPFEVIKRKSGKSSFSFIKLSNLASVGLTSFSNLPLRISICIGIFTSCSAITYAFWILLRTLLYGVDLPGWSTLVVATLFLGGIQLIAIGLLGEYISHIFTEVKDRPHYIISEIYDFTPSQRKKKS